MNIFFAALFSCFFAETGENDKDKNLPVVVAVLPISESSPPVAIAWVKDFDDAVFASRVSHKPIMIWITSDG